MNRKSKSVGIFMLFAAALTWSLPGFTGEGNDAKKPTQVEKEAKVEAAEPEDENILLNASFEEGDKSPKDWTSGAVIDGVEYLWDKKEGKKGTASICLKKTANRYFPIAQWFQIIDRKAGSETLQISAQVKAARASKAIIDVIFLDENSEWISHEWASYIGAKKQGDPPATHDWKEYTGKVKIPPNTRKIQVALQIYGPGKVWFDEVRAEYVE